MGKIIDIEIHSIRQTPLVIADSKGNIVMKMITEQLKKKEKEKNDASNDS
jgi:hypothetical protein